MKKNEKKTKKEAKDRAEAQQIAVKALLRSPIMKQPSKLSA